MDYQRGGVDSPASTAFAITPNDSTDLTTATRALYVGTAGNISVVLLADSAAVTLKNVAVGYHPLRVKRVRSTGTTAGDLVGLA